MITTLGRRAAVAGAVLSLAFAGGARADAPAAKLPAPVADHHLHIQGPDISATLKALYKRNPKMFGNLDLSILEVHTGQDVIRLLDEAGIGQGVLLSQAYTFTSPFVAAEDRADADAATRRENRYNVDAALASHGRLVAFISVNPLARGALPEIAYWAGRPGVAGLKLHLGNSGFDPASDADFASLAKVFDAARKARLPLVIHLSGAKAYATGQIGRFIDEVLPHAGELPVQIAHAGGGGGVDAAQLADLAAFGDAIARRAPGTRNLVIDLAMVIADPADDPAMPPRLAELIRRIGPQRFVLGSDWPAVLTPKAHIELQETLTPLTEAEWRIILANRAPYLR